MRNPTRLVAAIYAVSTSVALVAACAAAPTSWPAILRAADVGVAALLVALVAMLWRALPGTLSDAVRARSFDLLARVVTIQLAAVGVLAVSGALIHWDIVAIGLGWRIWLLTFALPRWVAAHERLRDSDCDGAG